MFFGLSDQSDLSVLPAAPVTDRGDPSYHNQEEGIPFGGAGAGVLLSGFREASGNRSDVILQRFPFRRKGTNDRAEIPGPTKGALSVFRYSGKERMGTFSIRKL